MSQQTTVHCITVQCSQWIYIPFLYNRIGQMTKEGQMGPKRKSKHFKSSSLALCIENFMVLADIYESILVFTLFTQSTLFSQCSQFRQFTKYAFLYSRIGQMTKKDKWGKKVRFLKSSSLALCVVSFMVLADIYKSI